MNRKAVLMMLLCFALHGAAALADDRATPAGEDQEPQERDLLRAQESPTVEPQRGPVNQNTTGPRVDVDPSVIGLPPGATLPRARREGAFIVNQPGRVLRPDDASQWIFQPMDLDDEANELPPMLVLPSARLEMMETYMQEQGGDAAFEVSGRVHAYRGVNYLLLTQARPQVDAPADDEAETAESEQAQPADEDEDPMLRALLEQRQAAPAASREQMGEQPRDRADVVAGSAPRGAEAAEASLREEGSFIVQRRGRVMYARDGGHVLFVLDADGRESPESPMILQPCRLLATMERIVQQGGDQVLFTVSGQVQRYRGANYLLPTMMRVVPDKGNLGR
ncbi:MAG: hypothetical protein WD294_05970 [Phycisphaeraceae bacterium]